MWVLLAAAVVLVLVGGALLLFVPVSFGWTAYAPLQESFSFTDMYPLTPGRAAGAGLAVLGLLLTVAVLGWVLGRRSAFRDLIRSGVLRTEDSGS
jgi:type II secretory pathway pseudopilin PulG